MIGRDNKVSCYLDTNIIELVQTIAYQMIALQAHAKINLTLEVLSLRDDGYHEIVSIIQTISLHDDLTIEPAKDITLDCNQPELANQGNLMLKAAILLKEVSGVSQGAHLVLNKVIPVAAGLGGGSSDAAATLHGLNSLWSLGLSVEELLPIAACIGSDVPFFLYGGTAIVLGRGERIRTLPPANLQWVVLLTPSLYVPDKTRSLYVMLSPGSFTRGDLTRKLESRIRGGGDVPTQLLFNVFDSIASEAFPDIQAYWDVFQALGVREIHLAGSGPTLFAPISQKEQGSAIELLLRCRHGWDARLVSLWHPEIPK